MDGKVFLSKNGPDEFDIGNFDKMEKEINYIEALNFDHTKAEQTIIASWITSKDINIKPISMYDEMSSSYLSYAMSVIISRALPDIRDLSLIHI